MPTTKPRITVTLTDHQHEVLSRMSGLSRTSMSAIVVDMLDTALPMLERVVSMMQAAADAPQQVREGMVASFERAERDLLPQLNGMMGQLEMLLAPGGVPALAGARPGASAPKGARPPTSNRGVRMSPKLSNSPAVSPMKTTKKSRGVKK
jgi:hypothetical protein